MSSDLSDQIEAAIRDLLQAIAIDADDESLYQAIFENHSEIWRSLGYEKSYPHVRLPLPDNLFLVPDFLASRPNGLTEIVELKEVRQFR
jgi:hypothetical protein